MTTGQMAAGRIRTWLNANPAHAATIAEYAVCGLYMERGEFLGTEDEFNSAADYVDSMGYAFIRTGIDALIAELQKEADERASSMAERMRDFSDTFRRADDCRDPEVTSGDVPSVDAGDPYPDIPDRLSLVAQVSEAFRHAYPSWELPAYKMETPIGSHIAYLFAAIVEGGYYEMLGGESEKFGAVLGVMFEAGHPVWDSVADIRWSARSTPPPTCCPDCGRSDGIRLVTAESDCWTNDPVPVEMAEFKCIHEGCGGRFWV